MTNIWVVPAIKIKERGFVPILVLIIIFLAAVVAVGYLLLPKPSGVEYIKKQLIWPRPTATPTPAPGCYYQQVVCFTTPCDPILVCPTPQTGGALKDYGKTCVNSNECEGLCISPYGLASGEKTSGKCSDYKVGMREGTKIKECVNTVEDGSVTKYACPYNSFQKPR
ncbi:MAG: hypothetical protein HYW33_03540 [Candidatus Blackburnbacteria bacterium]|nr:hypothetical protein [Candidatus Blackburnbacteria bacterium]